MTTQKEPLDLNTATIENLTTLPGIGTALAERIIAARPFTSIEDLRRVSGIGSASIDRIMPFVYVVSEEPEPVVHSEEPASPHLAKPSSRVDNDASQESQPMQMEEEAAPDTSEETIEHLAIPPMTLEDNRAVETKALTNTKSGEKHEEYKAVGEPSPPKKPEKAQSWVRREEVYGISMTCGFITLLLSIGFAVGIIYLVNDGLRFVRPVDLVRIDQKLSEISAQNSQQQQDLDGLRNRLDNLDSLAGRVNQVETETKQIRTELDAVITNANEIHQRIVELDSLFNELQADVKRFQDFLDGLQSLLENLTAP